LVWRSRGRRNRRPLRQLRSLVPATLDGSPAPDNNHVIRVYSDTPLTEEELARI
jgi:hypothetical protein